MPLIKRLLGRTEQPPKARSEPRRKTFKLSADQIRPMAVGFGGCIATDKITVDGLPVRFMYREAPNNPLDSGWRFLSGVESDDYMDDPANHAVYDVNTIANFDPSITPFIDAPEGSMFEKAPDSIQFRAVDIGAPRKEDS